MSDHKSRQNGNIEWGGGGLKNAQKCIIVQRFMAKIVVADEVKVTPCNIISIKIE
jgi:hypothetical protein